MDLSPGFALCLIALCPASGFRKPRRTRGNHPWLRKMLGSRPPSAHFDISPLPRKKYDLNLNTANLWGPQKKMRTHNEETRRNVISIGRFSKCVSPKWESSHLWSSYDRPKQKKGKGTQHLDELPLAVIIRLGPVLLVASASPASGRTVEPTPRKTRP